MARAETFYIAPDICDVLTGSMSSVPDYALSSHVLPATAGFAWWAKPFVLPTADHPHAWRGIAWASARIENDEKVYEPGAWFEWLGGGISFYGSWSFGRSWHSEVEWNMAHAESDERAEDHIFRLACYGSVAAFFAFLRSPIVVTTDMRPPRFFRRGRSVDAQTLAEGITHVITPRAPQHRRDPNTPDSLPVDWQHRWIVRGHWRNQYYPSTSSHAPVYIVEYVKGPEDKPLKPVRGRLFHIAE